jgi:hypothetical protein
MLYLINLKGRIPLLFYCVKDIHGQFKPYLKLQNFHFKQIAKTIPILLNPFCFVSYRFPNLYDTISFDMSCFHCAVLYGVLTAVICIVFSKVKWKVLLILYFECHSFTFHFTKFLSYFLYLKKVIPWIVIVFIF